MVELGQVVMSWFFNAFQQGCCCANDEETIDRFGNPDERPVAYSSHWEPGPDPMGPAKVVVPQPSLRELKAFYHLSDVCTGVKTQQYDFTAHFVGRFYKAINAAAELGWDRFMSLWADERAGISMESFAGSIPLRTRYDIQAFLESFPAMTVEATSVKVAQDELQAATSCIFHLQDPPAGVPSKINCVSLLRLNGHGRLVSLRMFWHPSEIGGASKTSQYEITARRVRGFVDALNNGDKSCWAEQSGLSTLEDPVGTLSRSVGEVVEAYLSGLPPFKASLRMVRVAQDELQAAAVIDFQFPNSAILRPFCMIFTFRFE